ELKVHQRTVELENQNKIIIKQKEEKENLMRETHHRVKNNMQIIQSLIGLQLSQVDDPNFSKLLSDCNNRIASMSAIHEMIYNSHDLKSIETKSYITKLTNDLVKSYAVGFEVELKIEMADFFLETNTSMYLGLVINEVVSNSLKHAFTGRDNGIIRLSLRMIEGEKYELIISDNGIGYDESEANLSFGSMLIETFTGEFHGTLRKVNDNGTKYIIEFMNES
ncbi:MAG: sensor histidine kinase, partial [Flavobacteriales bacterium]|nr:sensor histidine kinase [Flavobacteriales bacterium]